jgi:hypothetical protein
MTATATATKLDQITRAANGGGILANQILGCAYAAPHLARKIELVQRRIDRIAAGHTPHNTDAEYAQIISQQIGQLADVMAYNHPDAAFYAQQDVVHGFRTGGLAGVIKAIQKQVTRAQQGAAPLHS